jgi:hypothetical protein
MENFDETASVSAEERSLIAEAECKEAELKAEVSIPTFELWHVSYCRCISKWTKLNRPAMAMIVI